MPVLSTKVRLPPLRSRVVERERLTDRLAGDAVPDARLVLVAAPAGFGKTTLLVQWLAAVGSERKVAWLALDAGDAEMGVFLRDLVAAIQRAVPEAGADAVALLEAGGSTPDEAVLVSLINDLDALAGPMVIALDDYHVIDEPAVHDAVSVLLDNLPSQVTVAMTTRADPPLPLSRLRARGQLVEIRAADLRFDPEEAEAFLNDVMGLQLEPAWVAALEARTEGWAAGLQLAALSARTHADAADGPGGVAAFVEDFSGSHRIVLDYLVEEVLDRQPDHVRGFLLDTSVLDALTGELGDALTGRADGRDVLELLERENVFVVPLDEERRWFRYHHLFADALRSRLTARQPDRARELHAIASRWFAEHGMLRESITHAVASDDAERAADLVELGLADLRRRRENRTILDWLAALPGDVVRVRPLLAMYMGWRTLADGDIDGVAAWLDAAEANQATVPAPIEPMSDQLDAMVRDREEELRSVPAMVAVYRASVAQARGDIDGSTAHATRALALAGPEDHFPRGAAAGFVGMAAWAAGDPVAAVDTFTEAVDSLRAAGMVADELGATVVLADMWRSRGRPTEARRLLEHALMSSSGLGVVLPTAGDLHVALAGVLCEQGELDGAGEHLEIARQVGEVGSLPENRHRWYVAMAGLLQALGDLDGAVGMLDEAETSYLPGFVPDLSPIASMRARVWVQQNRHDAARDWARERGVRAGDPMSYLAEHDHLTLARLLVAEGEAGASLALLDRIVEAATSAGREASLVEACMVRAVAHQAAGDADSALQDLAAAVGVGEPAGYCRLFLDEGPPMIDLLEALARKGEEPVRASSDRLLASDRRQPEPDAAPNRPDLPDPLSDRELEVLRLLGSELSGPEIASHLFVSVNTLRTHTKRIFTKLGVNTRRAAVARAAELGLR